MKIQQLFDALKEKSDAENAESIFAESRMINRCKELDYGFFPLGSGILTDRSKVEEAEISESGIMVLGNDFGTVSYIKNKCRDNRENKNNSTIRNILSVGLDIDTTFFTNFYLGLRIGEGATMTKRDSPISERYKKFCYEFFLIQLELVKPRLVLWLGKDVDFTLHEKWIDKNLLTKYKFEFIPHPSFAHINWKEPIKTQIISLIKKTSNTVNP